MEVSTPIQLLEINIISAQDLAPVSKSVKAYAVVWLNPARKLASQIDQDGHTNPTWNEKFVFRVGDEFLNSESSVIMIQIYSSAWLRDVLVGTVGVLVSNLLPAASRSGNRKPKLRFVALQIRRPSGRPQGILNIGVTLLDSRMRSMPMYSELSTSAVGYWDLMNPNSQRKKKQNDDVDSQTDASTNSKFLTLQRCQSERNDSTINDYVYRGNKKQRNGYVLDGSDSNIGLPRKGGGLVNANGSLCSDIGPSPSVVAAAIAKGLYPMPQPRTAESSAFDEWSEKHGTEGMKTKIERWRTEVSPAYSRDEQEALKKFKRTPRRADSNRKGLFSCFGKVFGCEITITCGGAGRKKKRARKAQQLTAASEITYDESSFV